ncbi:MAG: class I SAM-dependent methyltransferase, partial [Gemmatimonadales bacterium]
MSSTPTNPVIEEYDRIATRYDRRWSFYIDATVQETLRRLDVRHGEHVLDVGCGTGVLLEALSAKLPAACLSGADPSPEMLEVARRRLAETIVLKYCSAENLSFAEEVFDVVI